jgi:hypothetical protein
VTTRFYPNFLICRANKNKGFCRLKAGLEESVRLDDFYQLDRQQAGFIQIKSEAKPADT